MTTKSFLLRMSNTHFGIITLFTIICMFFVAPSLHAQCTHSENVAVPQSNSWNNVFPLKSDNQYNYTETIYSPEELCGAGVNDTIYAIAYYQLTSQNHTKDIEIWLAETTKDQYSSGTDWVSRTSATFTLVYRGTYSFNHTGWAYIVFNQNGGRYIYSGDNNLVVAVLDNSKSKNNTAARFSKVSESDYKSISLHRNGTAITRTTQAQVLGTTTVLQPSSAYSAIVH